jgi:TonB family protein
MRGRAWVAAAALAASAAAGAASRIDVKRLGEVKPGMTAEQVHATIGTPEIAMEGAAPGRVEMHEFVFTASEKPPLYIHASGMAAYGPDGRLLEMRYAHAPDEAAEAGLKTPHGHSDSLAPFAGLEAYATDPAWGYRADRPIHVGGLHPNSADASESAFLNALRGPHGEIVDYLRQTACCQFDTPRGVEGRGFVDVFELRLRDRPEVILLYLDRHDPGPRDVPAGFTYRLDDVALRNAPLPAGDPGTAPAADQETATPVRFDPAHCTPPGWPPGTVARQDTGTLTLLILVKPDGSVKQVVFGRANGPVRLQEASALAFSQCRFLPATRDGKPVAGWVVVDHTWKRP